MESELPIHTARDEQVVLGREIQLVDAALQAQGGETAQAAALEEPQLIGAAGGRNQQLPAMKSFQALCRYFISYESSLTHLLSKIYTYNILYIIYKI